MSSEPHRVVTFRGGVSCRREAQRPPGPDAHRADGGSSRRVGVSRFQRTCPETLPEVLEEPTWTVWMAEISDREYSPRVDRRGHRHPRASGDRDCFYRAIPPRSSHGQALVLPILLAWWRTRGESAFCWRCAAAKTVGGRNCRRDVAARARASLRAADERGIGRHLRLECLCPGEAP